MADTTRYTKTDLGALEISSRRKNLRGRERTMLILIDPSKTADELRASAARIGVEPDFLQTLVRDGYIVAVAGTEGARPNRRAGWSRKTSSRGFVPPRRSSTRRWSTRWVCARSCSR
jgi:hypothetical protein